MTNTLPTYSNILRGLLHPFELLLIHDCRGCACDSASFGDKALGARLKLEARAEMDRIEGGWSSDGPTQGQ